MSWWDASSCATFFQQFNTALYKHVLVWFLIHYLNSSYDNGIYSTAKYISVRKIATPMLHYTIVYLCN